MSLVVKIKEPDKTNKKLNAQECAHHDIISTKNTSFNNIPKWFKMKVNACCIVIHEIEEQGSN